MKESNSNPPLLRSLSELPQDIAPTRDLWPGIAAAAAPGTVLALTTPMPKTPAPIPSASRSRLPRFALGIAASVALLALGVWLGRSMLPGGRGSIGQGQFGQSTSSAPNLTASATATPFVTVPATLAASFALDAASSQERQRRLNALAGQLTALPPKTQAKVQASLATIEKSVREIQTELGRDPGNLLLQEMLVNSYQEEMRVLGAVDDANREII